MSFRHAMMASLMIVTALAGCTEDGASPLAAPEPVPTLKIIGVTYEDQWCDDDVPIAFVIGAEGQGTAKDVHVTVSGGYQDASHTVGALAAGEARNVNVVIRADDACGSTDIYNVIITATSSNAATATIVEQIDI